jgi:hypothetical protein
MQKPFKATDLVAMMSDLVFPDSAEVSALTTPD